MSQIRFGLKIMSQIRFGLKILSQIRFGLNSRRNHYLVFRYLNNDNYFELYLPSPLGGSDS